jgi:hypothetical protein
VAIYQCFHVRGEISGLVVVYYRVSHIHNSIITVIFLHVHIYPTYLTALYTSPTSYLAQLLGYAIMILLTVTATSGSSDFVLCFDCAVVFAFGAVVLVILWSDSHMQVV